MKKLILLALLFSLNAKLCAQVKPEQKAKFLSTYNNLKTLVESQDYQFIGEWVHNTTKREKLEENSSYISINGSEVLGNLVALGNDRTFNILGVIEEYQVLYDEKNLHISINFKVNDYKVYIDIKPYKNAFLKVEVGTDKPILQIGKMN